MPETTKSQLAQVRTTLGAVAGVNDEDIVTGRRLPQRKGRETIMVIPVAEPLEEIDGYGSKRTLRVDLVAAILLDAGNEAARWDQLMDRWEVILPALEQLMRDNNNGRASSFKIDPSGVEWLDFDIEQQRYATVAVSVLIEWERDLGTITQPA